METSHAGPHEETGKFSENPSAGSPTEFCGLKVVSYLKVSGKEPTGDMCIRISTLSHHSRRIQPFSEPSRVRLLDKQIN